MFVKMKDFFTFLFSEPKRAEVERESINDSEKVTHSQGSFFILDKIKTRKLIIETNTMISQILVSGIEMPKTSMVFGIRG